MSTIAEVRQQFPQYRDLSDDQLAGALHRKFYSDMPAEEFRAKIGLSSIPTPGGGMQALPNAQPQGGSFLDPLIGQGVMMGFGDEAKAGVRGAARRMFGGTGKSLSDLYSEELGGARKDLGEFQQRHPVLSPALEIGGAVATAPFIPGGAAARGANLLQRTARGTAAGAGQGAVYGAGTAEGGVQDRALGAAKGAGIGAVAGAAAPLVVRGAQAGIRGARDYLAAPAVRMGRGAIATDREAARQIGSALARDRTTNPLPLTRADRATAAQRGMPVYNIDRGGERTRALAQNAGNLSPEGRAALQGSIDERFQEQAPRIESTLRQIVGGTGSFATREALEQQAQRQNVGAYRLAYRQGDRPIRSPTIDRLMSSPAIVTAMRGAAQRGRDRAVAEGMGGFNPGVTIDPSGIVNFQRGRTGVPIYPNVQYWDYVQRELRDAATAAGRRGENEQAGALTGLRNSLNSELDRLVPEFNSARRGAARFFGAESALEAGELFGRPGSRTTPAEAQAAFRRMSTAERQLFAEGLTESVTTRIRGKELSQNVLRMFNNTDMPERLRVALGPARAREFEAALHVERVLDQARKATTGFSTTFRQFAENQAFNLGAGGVAGAAAGIYSGDWRTAGASALAGALLRHGGARINQNVARRVAEMLASEDPAVVRRGMQLVANNDQWVAALRRADLPVAAGAVRAERERRGAPLR